MQPLSLQPDLWCSQVLRKQGFLTLQVLQVLSHPETPWARHRRILGRGEHRLLVLLERAELVDLAGFRRTPLRRGPGRRSPAGAAVVQLWPEPANVVSETIGQTGPGVDVTEGVQEPEAGGSEAPMVGDGSAGPRLLVAGDRSGADSGRAPGEADGVDEEGRRDGTAGGGGVFAILGCGVRPGRRRRRDLGRRSIGGGAASAGVPGWAAGTAAESNCGFPPDRSTVSSRIGSGSGASTGSPRDWEGAGAGAAAGNGATSATAVGSAAAAAAGRVGAKAVEAGVRGGWPYRRAGMSIGSESFGRRPSRAVPPAAGDGAGRAGRRIVGRSMPLPAITVDRPGSTESAGSPRARSPRPDADARTRAGTGRVRRNPRRPDRGFRPAQALLDAGASGQAQQQHRHDSRVAKPPHGVSSRLVVVDPSIEGPSSGPSILLTSSMESARRTRPRDPFGGPVRARPQDPSLKINTSRLPPPTQCEQ